MLQRLICILLVLIPFFGSAQGIKPGTPEYERMFKDDCEGKIFTKSQELPTFKISKQAFEDSLTLYLKANQAFDTTAKFSLFFLLTKKSKILELGGFGPSHHGQAFMRAFSIFQNFGCQQNKWATKCALMLNVALK